MFGLMDMGTKTAIAVTAAVLITAAITVGRWLRRRTSVRRQP